jgi:hypothetical protein
MYLYIYAFKEKEGWFCDVNSIRLVSYSLVLLVSRIKMILSATGSRLLWLKGFAGRIASVDSEDISDKHFYI